ncbi:CD3073 family putative ECF transporter S component [Clostridium hydrogeniformans]|uniref:CD3073 family putative ECF transporter S component n=1 Tax=Clostridium hydrogeniformans TaxID=349933 RepID=UPI00054FBA8B|nr:CD3073 family putative ECF transporter S component [Clostridium hydrogeniformans]
MRNNKSFILVLCSIAIGINIALGALCARIPYLSSYVFLDTIGTIFIAALFGPISGATVGAISNILAPILSGNPRTIPFFLVNMAVGLVVGLIAKKFNFSFKTALLTGISLSIICPLVGTPISVYLFDGVVGSGTDVFFTILKNSGVKVFSAAFIPRVFSNFIDKILCCLLVSSALKYIPLKYREYNSNF